MCKKKRLQSYKMVSTADRSSEVNVVCEFIKGLSGGGGVIGRLPVNSKSWFSFIYMLLEKWSFNAAYLDHLTLGLIRKLTKKRRQRTKSIDDLRGLISCGEIE